MRVSARKKLCCSPSWSCGGQHAMAERKREGEGAVRLGCPRALNLKTCRSSHSSHEQSFFGIYMLKRGSPPVRTGAAFWTSRNPEYPPAALQCLSKARKILHPCSLYRLSPVCARRRKVLRMLASNGVPEANDATVRAMRLWCRER